MIFLEPEEGTPDLSGEERWLTLKANGDGGFYGTGRSRTPSGESVLYKSSVEDDVSLERALAAAMDWAIKYSVPKIWIHREPSHLRSD